MSMRKTLQQAAINVMNTAVGPTSAAAFKVKTFEIKLRDFDPAELPMVVTFVRQKDMQLKEIGQLQELWQWQLQFYFIDLDADWPTGEERRDYITDQIESALSKSFTLNNAVQTINVAGNVERVYDSNFTSVLFDSSGQDGYYTFVSELYLSVDTQRN